MHRPVLVTAPAFTPVSLPEAKVQLAVDHDEHDAMITGFIAAAIDHLDGWTGILGRALVEQTWRQDFDGFARKMRLALAPVASITSITWRNSAGQISTVSSSDYTLLVDDLGPYVEFKSDVVFPTGLNETKPVSVTYLAGYSVAAVPPAIKATILIHVRLMYDAFRLGKDAGPIPMAAIDALIAPYRRVLF